MNESKLLARKFALIWPHLDERSRRMMAAGEARQLGYGGVSKVSDVCGLSRVTITKAMRELDAPPIPSGRIPSAYPYGIYDPGRNTGSANGTVNLSPHSFHGEWNYTI